VSATSAASGTLLGHRPVRRYFWARGFSEFAYQMAAVAVGWQIYALTGSAFDLGMVGLVQFVPTAVLTFVAGHAADRYDRQRVVQICQLVEGLTAAFLAWGSFAGWLSVPEIFAAVALLGAATAFESPAAAALLPGVAPEGMLQRATAIATGAFQVATISGPALGGLAYALAPGVPYAVMAVFWLLAGLLNGAIRLERAVAAKPPPSLTELFAGVGFVRRNPAILGTISLDLFAVLLGGATALLPIYASDILQVGPVGLGWLRCAPGVGAALIGLLLANRPVDRNAGPVMLACVAAFGAATLVFAVSTNFWLSFAALGIAGGFDMVSVVIRQTLVQLTTPDAMRGRVSAVNWLFIGASGQLGEFESGLVAALIGTVPAAIVGGVGTLAIVVLWATLFPGLRKADRLPTKSA
jgi:MFS family permease